MKTRYIPFGNPHAGYRERREEILCAVTPSLDSGWYILGAEVELFEQGLRKTCACSTKYFAEYV